MNHSMGTLLIVLACAGVLLIGAVRKKAEWLLNFVMRGVLGAVAIYFLNMALFAVGISSGVGINAVTILTSGFLGIPGVLGLYLIGFYQML